MISTSISLCKRMAHISQGSFMDMYSANKRRSYKLTRELISDGFLPEEQ